MSPKIKVLTFLILVFPKISFCCLQASQERILPIGTHDNSLIALEVIGHRYSEGDFFEKELWHYEYQLKSFKEDYSVALIQELGIDKRVENNQFEHLLIRKINQAIKIGKTLENFEILKPKSVSFCDFQRNCNLISLEENKGELRCRLKEMDLSYPIAFFNSDYLGTCAKFYKENYEMYNEDQVMGFDLKISSVRTYENSVLQLTVFQLGRGQEFENAATGEYPTKKETSWNKEFSSIKNFIFEEPILHHGDGFDYFVSLIK